MRSPRLLLAAPLALLAGLPALAAPPCATIQTRGAENPGKTETGFSVRTTTDVVFTVLLHPSFVGDHLLELRVLTPRGHHYQTLSVPLTSPGGPDKRAVPGYPRPLKTRVPKESSLNGNRVLEVEVPFPVGGTMIQATSLYGAWSVEPVMDGGDEPCAKGASFTIAP